MRKLDDQALQFLAAAIVCVSAIAVSFGLGIKRLSELAPQKHEPLRVEPVRVEPVKVDPLKVELIVTCKCACGGKCCKCCTIEQPAKPISEPAKAPALKPCPQLRR